MFFLSMHYFINLLILGNLGLFRFPSLTHTDILLMLECTVEPLVPTGLCFTDNRVAEMSL